jgi:hypothetical protein
MKRELFGCFGIEVKALWILLAPNFESSVSMGLALFVECDDHLFDEV